MSGLDALMPVVNDQNLLQGHCPRSNIHKPPFPIHQAVSVFLVGTDRRVYLQKRSLECPGFPNRLDVVGGHVKKFGQYLETVESEVRGETPLRVSRERFQRVLDGDNDFFKVRTSHNNENKAVFILRLEPAEEARFAETNEQLGYIWRDVAATVVRESRLAAGNDEPIEALRKRVHKSAERKITEVGQVLRDEFQRRLDVCAHDPAKTELLKMAREVVSVRRYANTSKILTGSPMAFMRSSIRRITPPVRHHGIRLCFVGKLRKRSPLNEPFACVAERVSAGSQAPAWEPGA